jgi:hypothetical protein
MPPRIEINGVREQHARSWRRNVRIRRIERILRESLKRARLQEEAKRPSCLADVR